MIYNLVVGKPPFVHTNAQVALEKITTANFKFPTTLIDAAVKDIVQKLLVVDVRMQ